MASTKDKKERKKEKEKSIPENVWKFQASLRTPGSQKHKSVA